MLMLALNVQVLHNPKHRFQSLRDAARLISDFFRTPGSAGVIGHSVNSKHPAHYLV